MSGSELRRRWPAVLGLVLVAACDRPPELEPLAHVGGEPITRLDLDLAERRTLGGAVAQDSAVRRRILESLVMNRALAIQAEPQLSAHDRRVMDAELAAHRDQLLARMHLARREGVAPPGETEVRAYYEAHPERFGAEPDHAYEMIALGEGADVAAAQAALAEKDWRAAAARLSAAGTPAQFREGSSADLQPDAALRARVEAIAPGQAEVVRNGQRAWLVRVLEQRTGSPRPLSEVRHEIVQALALQQARDALRAAGEEALRAVEVEYVDR